MFSLFKRKKEPSFYFNDYPPNERINNFILKFLKSTFDKNDFDFKKTEFQFCRKSEDFNQIVNFKRSIHNAKDTTVRFDIQFSIFDEGYAKWHNSFYGHKTEEYQIFGKSGAHIQNWDSQFLDNTWYDLAVVDNDELVTKINNNIESVGIPLLSELSNRRKALVELRQTSFNICPILFDYTLMLDDKNMASLIITDFESYLNGKYKDQYLQKLQLYQTRKDIYEKWA